MQTILTSSVLSSLIVAVSAAPSFAGSAADCSAVDDSAVAIMSNLV